MNLALVLALLLPLPAAPAQESGHAAHAPRPDSSVYTIAEGAHTARIPFRFVANQVRIDALVDGKGPFHLTLDTGMPIPGVLLFESEAVTGLGLADSGAHVQVAGAGGEGKTTDALMATGITIGLGPLSIAKTGALVVPVPEGFAPGSDGVIGGALFFRYVVRIDMDAKQLVLAEPEGWSPPEGAVSVPLVREGGMVFTDLRVAVEGGEPQPAHVVVDIGAGHALSLNGKPSGRFEALAKAVEMPLGRGMSGVLLGKSGRVRRVELGGFAFDSVVVSFPGEAHQRPGGGEFHDGNLGEGILKRFNVTFDYAGKRMLLEKAAGFDEPFETEMAGLAFDWHRDGSLEVRNVLSDSPAAAAGIRPGDRLLAIDGKPVSELGEDGLHDLLRGEGTERRLRLSRGGEVFEKTLRLRRLV